MKLGIIGLPNVGKSTLFNSLTKSSAETSNYPFCTTESNVGVAAVPDPRLAVLERMNSSKKVVPATIEFVDIAGLVRGAGSGQGLGNKFLSYIREVDALVHVVRCFEDDNVVHVDGSVDPLRDIETTDLELIFADLEAVEKRIVRVAKAAKADKSMAKEAQLLEKLKQALEGGLMTKSVPLDDDEATIMRGINLLTNKPVLYAANVSEGELDEDKPASPHVNALQEYAQGQGSPLFVVCAQIESEMSQLDDDERQMFMDELGLAESGLDKLIATSYDLLGLISFLTAGPKETRAWTITKGMKAVQAAGKIHSDIERGFIRAETVHFDDLTSAGSYNAAKEKGTVRLEGKEYIIKDGDVVLFRFNV
ncbi:MAG: redox-regulated ATPase YchF [Defluviitaleaceae bacterium]|nr:redox-regulated ATPase YchF [Defluviitaleaceae bacterium]